MMIKVVVSAIVISVGAGGLAYAQGMHGSHHRMEQDDGGASNQRGDGMMRGGMMQGGMMQGGMRSGREDRMMRQGGGGMGMDHSMHHGGGSDQSTGGMVPDTEDGTPDRRMGSGMMMNRGMMGSRGMMGGGMSHQGMMGDRGRMESGMMGGGQPGAWFGTRVVPVMNLSAEDVRGYLDVRIKRLGNKRLKVGDVKIVDDVTVAADIVTVDNSLVQRLKVDRHSGAIEYEN